MKIDYKFGENKTLEELKKYIEEEYKITKKRLEGINQTMKELI